MIPGKMAKKGIYNRAMEFDRNPSSEEIETL